LTLSSSIKPYRSDTYKMFPDADEQGAFFAITGLNRAIRGLAGEGTGRRFIGFELGCCKYMYC
jgi:hypothetical protein